MADTPKDDPRESRQKGKAKDPVEGDGKQAKRPNKTSDSSQKVKSSSKDDDILACLKSIQESQKQAENKVDSLVTRVADMENYIHYNYDEPCDDDGDDNVGHNELSDGEIDPSSNSAKTDDNSRFSSLAKRFKTIEVFGPKIDDTLAQNVTDLFRKGMNEEQFETLVKDEATPRPENCDGLQTVRMNRSIWDIMSSTARSMDSKLQKTETAIVKASVLLTKNLNKLAQLERVINDQGLNVTPIVEGLNDSVALLGHANYLSCMVRRDLLKPELKREFSHLCNHSIPYTNWLFGDDVSKTVKEIEESSRMGHKVHYGSHSQQSYPRRGAMRGRFRGNYRTRPYPSTSRGRGYVPDQTKNIPRRGGIRPSRN